MVATGQQLQQINTTNNHTSPEQPIEQQQQKIHIKILNI